MDTVGGVLLRAFGRVSALTAWILGPGVDDGASSVFFWFVLSALLMAVSDTNGWTQQRRWAAAAEMYESKIQTAARNSYFQVRDYDRADMEQELRVVLWRCVNEYDPNRGGSFSTFFWQSARNLISTLTRFSEAKSRRAETVSLDLDAVSYAVDELWQTVSTEETVIMRMDVRDYVATFGEKVLDGRQPLSRRSWARS